MMPPVTSATMQKPLEQALLVKLQQQIRHPGSNGSVWIVFKVGLVLSSIGINSLRVHVFPPGTMAMSNMTCSSQNSFGEGR
jgi:hypothetical protein